MKALSLSFPTVYCTVRADHGNYANFQVAARAGRRARATRMRPRARPSQARASGDSDGRLAVSRPGSESVGRRPGRVRVSPRVPGPGPSQSAGPGPSQSERAGPGRKYRRSHGPGWPVTAGHPEACIHLWILKFSPEITAINSGPKNARPRKSCHAGYATHRNFLVP